MAFELGARSNPHPPTRKDGMELKLYFAVAFVVFLVPAAMIRIVPRAWSGQPARGQRRSIFNEARARAGKIVPFLFMG